MAGPPAIVTSQTYSFVNLSTISIALPASTGDGYTLVICTNNGVLPLPPTSPTLTWKIPNSTSFSGYNSTATLPNGETGIISVYHASFHFNQFSYPDSGSCSGETVTISFTGTVDAGVIACLGITGTATFLPVGITMDLGVLNGPAYFVGNSQSQPAPLTFSTNDYNDLSICVNISDEGSLSNNCPNGYTNLLSTHINGAVNSIYLSLGYQNFTTSQNNISWNWGVISGFGSMAMEFAYSDGTGMKTQATIAQLINPLRKSKLINHIIGR